MYSKLLINKVITYFSYHSNKIDLITNFWKIIAGIIVASLLNTLQSSALYSQELPFGDYGNYTLEIENVSLSDLEFEGPVVRNGGIYEVTLVEALDLSITGVKYLDVMLQISGSGELLLNGDPAYSGDPGKSIPFTLKAAYANRGQNLVSDAEIIPVSTTSSSNIAGKLFPILARKNFPPGPPPFPYTDDFDQQPYNESAYLYLYGEIDVGNISAGSYSGEITVTVEYN